MKKILVLVLFFCIGFLAACDEKIGPDEEPIIEEPVIDPNYDRLFDDNNEKSFTIEITSTELNKLDQYMIEYRNQFGDYKTDAVVEAKLKYEDEQGVIDVENIAFRVRGNTSRNRLINDNGDLNPSSYKVYFDKAVYAQKGSVLHTFINERTVFGLTELNFKFNRNYESTYITEKFSYDLFNDFGVFAPKITHAKLYLKIDNKTNYLGIFNVVESIDQSFLTKRFKNEDQGNLYKVLWQQFGPASLEKNYPSGAIGIKDESIHYFPSYDLKTNKKTNDTSDIVTLINMLNDLEGSYFKTYIEANFDVDRLLRLLAVGVLLGNPDDYRAMGNNYYLYRNNVSGKWVMIPYDYDHGLGQGWDGSPVFTNYSIGMDIYTWGNLNSHIVGHEIKHPLTDKILEIPEYQLRYEGYLNDLIETGLFTKEAYFDTYLTVKGLYEDSVNQALWVIPFGTRNIDGYITGKTEDILNQLEYYQNNPSKRP